MSKQLYYLVEAATVGQDGALKGTSLRTYECTAEMEQSTGYGGRIHTRYNIAPTGYMYIMNEDSSLTKKKTKATLSNKYLSSLSELDSQTPHVYGCSLYTSPELALFSKLRSIYTQAALVKEQVRNTLRNLESFDKHLSHYREFANEHPELAL